jgi:hypothetical protein
MRLVGSNRLKDNKKDNDADRRLTMLGNNPRRLCRGVDDYRHNLAHPAF